MGRLWGLELLLMCLLVMCLLVMCLLSMCLLDRWLIYIKGLLVWRLSIELIIKLLVVVAGAHVEVLLHLVHHFFFEGG